jgi:hypothetical protein
MKKIFFCLLAMVLLSLNSYAQEERRPFNFDIRIETDIVHDFGNGCYEIQVRVVYVSNDYHTFTETWANVMVGNCPTQRLAVNQNEGCEDIEYKGDFIINSDHKSEKCFVEYLKDEATYEKYARAKEELISRIQK